MRRSSSVWSDHLPDGSFCGNFPENTMYEFLVERTGRALDRTAVEFEGKKTSYGILLKHIDRIAASLRFHNIGRGDIVSIISPNIPQAVEIEQICFTRPWSKSIFKATLLLPYAAYYVAVEEDADQSAGQAP